MPRSPFATADRRARGRTGWIAALLAALLVLLALLQYRWTGEVERAEEERARGALLRAAWSVSGELDGELARLYSRFVPLSGDPAAEIPKRLAAWRATALDPRLLRAVLVGRPKEGGWTLERWEEAGGAGAEEPAGGPSGPQVAAGASPGAKAGTQEGPPSGAPSGALVPTEWPAELFPLRERLAERSRPFASPGRLRAGSAELVPALIAPLGGALPGGTGLPFYPGRPREAGRREPGLAPEGAAPTEPPAILLLWLDTRSLSGALLPELIARHFLDGIDYRIEVVNAAGEPLYARGPDLGRARPDATVPLFTLHGPPRLSERQPFGPAGPQGPGARSFRRSPQRRGPPLPGGGEAGAQWQLRITHPAGSLSAAVARSRLRNLGISLLVLALLGASVLLVLLNSRRAEALARRQIELVAGVSHELLTPVAALRSAGENLAAGVVTEPEAVRRYGDLLVRESSRLGSLVEQVLTWAGLQTRGLPAAREAIEVAALLAEVAAAAAPAAEASGVRIETRVAPGVPAVLGDRSALERALRNLVENALKYGTAGPRGASDPADLTGPADLSGRWIGLGADPLPARRGRSPGVALWVEDRGPGVDAADLPHLFEPFYRGRNGTSGRGAEREGGASLRPERDGERGEAPPAATRPPVPGSGLGLALVWQIAREQGGRARVAPVPPRGLRFTLELPGAGDGR